MRKANITTILIGIGFVVSYRLTFSFFLVLLSPLRFQLIYLERQRRAYIQFHRVHGPMSSIVLTHYPLLVHLIFYYYFRKKCLCFSIFAKATNLSSNPEKKPKKSSNTKLRW